METHQTIINRLKELSDKLASSKLSFEELTEFETLAQKLYERTIILSYKAKEEKVFGDSKEEKIEVIPPVVEEIEEKTEVIVEEPKEEVKDLFQSNEEGVTFDFSGGFEEEEEKEEVKEVMNLFDEPKEIEVPNTVTVEPIQELAKSEDETREVNGDANTFLQRFEEARKLAATEKLANVKISSLKGAFGLNDKLLFIRELFNGNADSFNQTVEILDQQNSGQGALTKLSEIAAENNWSKDSKQVEEFAHLVIRRYVD